MALRVSCNHAGSTIHLHGRILTGLLALRTAKARHGGEERRVDLLPWGRYKAQRVLVHLNKERGLIMPSTTRMRLRAFSTFFLLVGMLAGVAACPKLPDLRPTTPPSPIDFLQTLQ